MKSFRFNPGFHTDEQAIENFIVRQRELQTILDAFSSDDRGRHRMLIVAPRGAGKTTLCRRVLAELRGSLFLRERWLPIFLGEESYSVTTPGEFLLECLFHLAHDPVHPMAEAEHREALQIEDEEALIAFCCVTFQRLAREAEKRFLIIAENLHMIFEQTGTKAGKLVALLSDSALFGVLATSVNSDEDAKTADLLRGFIVQKLEPLVLAECHSLWAALTGQEVERSRIRPLQILTGGSPRLLHILAGFMATRSLQDLMEHLDFLIDQNTEYFKSQLDALPGQERKVFVALLEAWDPSTARQIGDAARMDVNPASAMLNRLTERGAVMKQAGTGRSALYYAAERLFNIYYLMRRRSHPSNRVRALVAFMTQYYDRDELVDTTAMLAIEACGIEPAGRADYHNAFAAILKGQPEPVRAEILQRTPADFRESLSKDPVVQAYYPALAKTGGDRSLATLLGRSRKLIDEGDLAEGRRLLDQAIEDNPAAFQPWLPLAFLEMREGHGAAAIDAARAAIQRAPDNPLGHTVLGIALNNAHQREAAARAFEAALDRNPEIQMVLVELARIRHDEGRKDEALHLFERATALSKLRDDDAIGRLGQLLSDSGDAKRAERLLRATLKAKRDYPASRITLVRLLAQNDRLDEAEGVLRQAAMTSTIADPWLHYASFKLQALDEAAEAKEIIENALARGIRDGALYHLLAQAMQALDAPAAEIRAVAARIGVDLGRTAVALRAQAEIFELLGDMAAAEAALREALAIDDADVHLLTALGKLLARRPGKLAEAERVFRRLVELYPNDDYCGPLKDLATVRVHRGDDADAIRYLDRALAAREDCECSLVLRGDIAWRNGDPEKAVKLLGRALEVNPNSIAAMTTLARVDGQDAEALIARAAEADLDDPRVLLAQSRLASRRLAQRIEDATNAAQKDGDLVDAHIELTMLHGQDGDRERAIEHLAQALRLVPAKLESIPAVVNASLQLVRIGLLDEVIELLSGESGRAVEPLAVALRIHRGEKPLVAQEIREVADDILMQLNRLTSQDV